MSGPGDIPLGPVGRAALLEILAAAREVPFEALEEAARMPSKIDGTVLALMARAADGEELPERDANLLFWGLHVLAEVRDTRVFQPLLHLLRRPAQDIEFLLGDAVTASLTPVLVNTFDGDGESLLEIIRHSEIDDIVRWSLFGAGTYLTATEAIAPETYRALLTGFDDRRLASSSGEGWHGWAEAICLLGYSDLFPRIEAAFADGRLMDTVASVGDYHRLLADALARPDDLGRLAKDGLRPFGAAADELDWVASGDGDDPGSFENDSPVRNPFREVGRNDPCPCGSGKKFKKCCLEAA